MGKSKIEWTDRVLNVATGCTPVSEGCEHCYARRYGERFWKERKFSHVMTHPDRLLEPERLAKPQTIFLSSLGDLFHEMVPYDFLRLVLYMVFKNREHKFIMLTKRPQRMADAIKHFVLNDCKSYQWPPKNLAIGITAENQARANERIPLLLSIPAKWRFVSIEPMLGPVNISAWLCLGKGCEDFGLCLGKQKEHCLFNDEPYEGLLDWVIVGGESGPDARFMHPDWVRSIRNQCTNYCTPFFFKQWGEWAESTDSEIWDSKIKRIGLMSCEPWFHHAKDGVGAYMFRVGKTKAGRLLDGKQWLQFPWQ